MKENIQIKLFTAADLRQYFMHSQPVDLLSERVIAPVRAYAMIMNPYVKDDMALVSAIFVDGEVAAYTYAFPDKLEKPDRLLFWNTVLYFDPKYEGRGYGYVVIGQMVEQYGDAYFDLDAVPASVENLKYAGLTVEYVDQYVLDQKKIHTDTFRGKLAHLVETIRLLCVSRKKELQSLLKDADYTLAYRNYIDDEAYDFIRKHSGNDLFLRSQQMLNWILTYPFAQESPVCNRVQRSCAFASIASTFRFYAVEVRKNGQLAGVYIMRHAKGELYLNYLYFDADYKNDVFLSIAEHVIKFQEPRLFTAHKEVRDFIADFHLFAKQYVYKKSFSYPDDFVYDKTKFIQAGDGDNIT